MELLGGAALSLVLGLLLQNAALTTILGLMVSMGYERFLDRNGWSWVDVGQRACGQVLGLGLMLVLT